MLPGFATEPEVEALNRTIDAFVARTPHIDDTVAFYGRPDRPESIMQLQRLEEHDDDLRRLFHSERMTSLAGELLQDEVVPRSMEWFAKPPRIGLVTPPHQDAFWWRLEPSNALTLWLSLDAIDLRNGCIRYLPGSHLLPLRPHRPVGITGFSNEIADYGETDHQAEKAITTAPGDLIAHHANTAHRAAANRSTRTRRALGMVYFAASARPAA